MFDNPACIEATSLAINKIFQILTFFPKEKLWKCLVEYIRFEAMEKCLMNLVQVRLGKVMYDELNYVRLSYI